jgi:hypothetical protein
LGKCIALQAGIMCRVAMLATANKHPVPVTPIGLAEGGVFMHSAE